MVILKVMAQIVALILLSGVNLVCGQEINDQQKSQTNGKTRRAPSYRVGQKYYTVEASPTLVIYISVEPRYFNRDDMVVLAHRLNKDFLKEPKISAIMFNNYRAARDFVFSQHSPTFKDDLASMRGSYHLDRFKGEEYISFSPDPNKPRDEVRINLSTTRR